MVTAYKPPTDANLWLKALGYYRTCRQAEYDTMRRDATLKDVIGARVAACKSLAQRLIDTGVWEGEAWNQAIRVELLGSESN